MDDLRSRAMISALVRDDEVHRDVYVSPSIFDLEMRHLFANTWVYVGHASQIPKTGDYYTTTIGTQPVIMCRDQDGTVHVLRNRCAHKGVKIAGEVCGNTGKFFRCPYHAWSFKLDGSLLAIPQREGYDERALRETSAAAGLGAVGAVKVYRDFVFARLADEGVDFEAFFGVSLSSLDNMIDRSPQGRLEVAGAPLRYMHHCNWKMLVENQTDACHPMVAHESSAGTAVRLWKEHGGDGPKPMAVEVIEPFLSPLEFYEKMGVQVWPNGHGHTGTTTSIHANYSAVEGYWDQMVAAYGEEKAAAILGRSRHNTVYFPNIMVKGPIQIVRVFKPMAVDKTLVESWCFRLVGAPDMLLERTLMYNRLINAPTSIVGHDDLEMYERAQEGLSSPGNDWVNLQRLYEANEAERGAFATNGLSEVQMRNQFRTWLDFMTRSLPVAA